MTPWIQNDIMAKQRTTKRPREIAVIGDVDSWQRDVIQDLLDMRVGAECVFYIDSAGGSVFGALAVATLMGHRKIKGTAIVLGECSSAAVLVFAACRRRFVPPLSTFLFHKMRWQSERRINSGEASLWARHFALLEKDLDDLQARLFGTAEEQVRLWTSAGQFVTGQEIIAAGLAEPLPT